MLTVQPSSLFKTDRCLCVLDGEVKSCGEALMSSCEYLKCLKVVMEARLQRDGYLDLPVGDSQVERVTDIQRALQLARLYLVPDSSTN